MGKKSEIFVHLPGYVLPDSWQTRFQTRLTPLKDIIDSELRPTKPTIPKCIITHIQDSNKIKYYKVRPPMRQNLQAIETFTLQLWKVFKKSVGIRLTNRLVPIRPKDSYHWRMCINKWFSVNKTSEPSVEFCSRLIIVSQWLASGLSSAQSEQARCFYTHCHISVI